MPLISIWWIRRDLRLSHNAALQAALESGRSIVPVFILDPHLLSRTAPNRQGFLFDGLRALDAALRARGSRLIVRRGEPQVELSRLVAESGAEGVFAGSDYSPYARRRDAAIGRDLPLHLFEDLTVHPPDWIHKADGSPYTVFTPFSKAWKNLPMARLSNQPLPDTLPPPPILDSLSIPEGVSLDGFPAGEEEALHRLDAFLSGPVFEYADDRNRLDLDGTSTLSPYLRFGMLSARQAASSAYAAAETAPNADARRGVETWLNELIWREFYISIQYHFPTVLQSAFNPAFRRVAWLNDPVSLQAWQAGQTGYPVVDAGMRQLLNSGWMHSRARMITASFLAKNCLVNWQEGERWFMRHLVDGDPAANNGGWQWTAGVGTDAAPYFRVFNPVLQGQKFDPNGDYVRRWVPELARVPAPLIHTPWLIPLDLQAKFGCRIGRDYPAPILDLATTRERALAAYQQARS